MKFVIAVISVALAFASCNATASVHPRADFSLAQYLLAKQTAALVTDPTISQECFQMYMPLLQEAATVWATDYQNCLDYAANNRTMVMNQMSDQQAEMSTNANEVCAYINNCETISDTLDYFNCFSGLSKNEIGTVYAISDNATLFATTLVQELEVINVNMYLCTNATERNYVETTASIYDALDSCLQNGLPATQPTEATSESTTATPETTTIIVPTTVETTSAVPVAPVQQAAALRLPQLSRFRLPRA